MPPARLSPAEIIADVPSCAKLSRAVSVTTSRQATAKSFIFTFQVSDLRIYCKK